MFEILYKAEALLAGVPYDDVFDDGERTDLQAWFERDRFDRRDANRQPRELQTREVSV